MQIFKPLYERAIQWARHPRAPALLTGLSFIEAIIFPVMPEVMLAPMCVANPKRSLWFATLSLAGSMAGALVGYALGHYAFEALKPLFAALGMLDSIEAGIGLVKAKMAESPWAVFTFLVLGGFMPIPMKVFTWASGIVGVPMLQYVLSMLIGRGKRVYLLGIAIRLGGARAEAALRRWIEPVGWIATALVVALVGWLIWRAST
ncbi:MULTISPECIES: YqaA family protein [unclassified Pseudoxanthomonas]|uniref:YqaA family protein n=1 Tax=unclassified Pseudoxanthomonas TaxID=2645906 RepID=UPI001612250D|nr:MULTISPECIES: YqaA family protein [unclassified Pseudoxanthomonas]MBB3275095.1 membrane protein YqaA with SNARE-associated domain [Pseudoxanthomonas sp. OG2]MBV7473813.1 DedA family protein [Pseudoxanthomonas sp. PXM05]